MERRKALKNIGLGFGSILTLPAWASSWNKDEIGTAANDTLAILVETIIPEGTEPGAKSLGVHQFVERIIRDCYDEKVNLIFDQKIEKVNEMAENKYSKKFEALLSTERLNMLRSFESSESEDEVNFYSLLKNLTVTGYTKSEYYLTTHRNYEMAPGYFHGCVAV